MREVLVGYVWSLAWRCVLCLTVCRQDSAEQVMFDSMVFAATFRLLFKKAMSDVAHAGRLKGLFIFWYRLTRDPCGHDHKTNETYELTLRMRLEKMLT